MTRFNSGNTTRVRQKKTPLTSKQKEELCRKMLEHSEKVEAHRRSLMTPEQKAAEDKENAANVRRRTEKNAAETAALIAQTLREQCSTPGCNDHGNEYLMAGFGGRRLCVACLRATR